jgi:hypothetical protein
VRLDGRLLRAGEAAPLRAAVHACARAQLLLALRDCVEQRWAGGFLGLRRAVVPLLGAGAARVLEPLAQCLLRVRARTCSPLLAAAHLPACALRASRTWEAQAYEACGAFSAAARVFKAACEEEGQLEAYFRCGARHAAAAQPMCWAAYGKACISAGLHHEAEAALEAGLLRLEGLLTEEDRESMRIELLHPLLLLHGTTGAHAKHAAARTRLFAMQIPIVTAAEVAAGAPPPGDAVVAYDQAARNYICAGRRSGRRFMVTQRTEHHYGLDVPHAVMHSIIELPIGMAPPAPHPDAFRDRTAAPLRMNAEQHALPCAPAAVCAQCGASGGGGLKHCAACMTTGYCSRACQVAHWRAHRAACRAATRGRPAGGAGAGAGGA